MLARGARLVAEAILDRGSCGESGMNTAAAIHKDILPLRDLAEVVRVEAVKGGVWSRIERDTTRAIPATPPKICTLMDVDMRVIEISERGFRGNTRTSGSCNRK